MSDKNPMPATDSARDLRNLVGDDVTADFESDPKFVDSNPTADASSENLAVLRKLAINILQTTPGPQRMRHKMLHARWNSEFLLSTLAHMR